MNLLIDFCSPSAAKYACQNFHYSGCTPSFKTVRFGVWENGQFIGAVIFGQGATPEIGKPFGLERLRVCELCRVALREHATPVSRILAITLKMLRKQSSGLKLVVSFADETQGHVGSIYQANGWLYLGAKPYHCYRVNGQLVHPKTLHSRYGTGGQSVPWLRKNVDPRAERVVGKQKHKYVMPFDSKLAGELKKISRPYPKRASSETIDTSGDQPEKGGVIPTDALHFAGADAEQ